MLGGIFLIKSKYRYLFIYISIIVLFGMCIIPKSFAANSVYVWSKEPVTVETSSNIDTSKINTVTTSTGVIGNFLNLSSGSAVLLEQNSGKILYEHNPHEQLRPASVTQVMTILLIMEAIDSGDRTIVV